MQVIYILHFSNFFRCLQTLLQLVNFKRNVCVALR